MAVEEVRDGISLSSLDSELFDDAAVTKGDLISYLDAVSRFLVPELKDRPLTVMRARAGQQPFMQKNLPKNAPEWIPTVDIWSQASRREVHYPLCQEPRTLIWFGNQRAVEYHPTLIIWPGPDESTAIVDRLLIDLDPPEQADFAMVVEVAQRVREVLARWELPSAVKTSGSKGLHIAVPVTAVGIEEAAAATRALAAQVAEVDPEHATVEYKRVDRGGRVYVDASRAGGATVAAAWSPRVRPGLPVSFPVAWDDLGDIRPSDFTISTVPRLSHSSGPWAQVWDMPVEVPQALVEQGRQIPSGRQLALEEGRRKRYE